MTYRILASISTRKSTNRESPDFEEFHDWHAGDEVESFPSWVQVKDLIESGHVERIVPVSKQASSPVGKEGTSG